MVVSAKNGAQAFDLAKEHQPHLIISYIQMPDMDGVKLNTLLHLEPRTKGIPVLMLTGNETLKMQIGINFTSTMKL